MGYRDATERMLDLHAEPLADALARGTDDGTLTSSDPYVDARSVLAIVDIVGERVSRGVNGRSSKRART